MIKYIPQSFSGKSFLFCSFFLLIILLGKGLPPNIISWDIYGYYLYLPQGIIHGDLGIEDFNTVDAALNSSVVSDTFYQATRAETGNWIIKYPMGISIFYLPFFMLGLFASWIGGYSLDGFSLPSEYAMILGSVFYMLLGLWLLRKILIHFYSDVTSGIAIVILVLGTNYYQIHTGSHCMPHVYLFTGYAALIWLTIKYYETKKLKLAIGIGLIIGLLTISRPTEIMSIIIPVFFGITSLDHFFQRLGRIFKWYKHILFAGLAIFIMILPQLIYWKVYAGHWFYNSYNNPGEGLDLGNPNILEFLFSFRKGWLLYTPVFLFAMFGMFRIRKHFSNWFWFVAIFTFIYIYVSSSWSSWWYATSFSQRTMVQVYPVLLLPLAFVIEFSRRSLATRSIMYMLVTVLITLNIFQTWQYEQGIIDPSRMTEKYYWKVFGKTSIPEGANKYLLVDRSTTMDEHIGDFSDNYFHKRFFLRNSSGSYRIVPAFEALDTVSVFPNSPSPKFEMAYNDLTTKDHVWILVSGKVKAKNANAIAQINVTSTFVHDDLAYKYQSEPLPRYLVESEENDKQFYLLYLSPEVRSLNDPFQFYMLNNSDHDTLFLYDVKIDLYQRNGMYE